jgi:hypothetical protein
MTARRVNSQTVSWKVTPVKPTSRQLTCNAQTGELCSQAVNVPVVIRDDAGNLLATDVLSLAASGHAAFRLATDRYPETANIPGTIRAIMTAEDKRDAFEKVLSALSARYGKPEL